MLTSRAVFCRRLAKSSRQSACLKGGGLDSLCKVRAISSKVLILFFAFAGAACAQETAEFDVNLIYGDESNDPTVVQDLIASGSISARILYSYEGLNGGTRVEPLQAAPPRCDGCDPNQPEVTEISWEKASNPGFDLIQNKVRVTGIPLNRRDLRIGIEFLKAITAPIVFSDPTSEEITEYYAVVRGCLRFNTNEPITKERLQSAFSQGIRLYAGRTCGICPPAEDEAFDSTTGAAIHMDQFTVTDLNDDFLPPACGEL